MAVTKLWLKQHGAGEKDLAAVLRRYFDDQRRRIVAALRSYSHPTPSIVPQIFQAATDSRPREAGRRGGRSHHPADGDGRRDRADVAAPEENEVADARPGRLRGFRVAARRVDG